jgi:hypothetical protein
MVWWSEWTIPAVCLAGIHRRGVAAGEGMPCSDSGHRKGVGGGALGAVELELSLWVRWRS